MNKCSNYYMCIYASGKTGLGRWLHVTYCLAIWSDSIQNQFMIGYI